MDVSSPAAIQRERDRARERARERRATPEYRAWLERSRELRRALKEKYRRKAGVKSRAERKAETVAKRALSVASARAPRAQDLTKPCDAHVKAWGQARPGERWVHLYRTDAEFNAKEKLRARLRKLAAADTDLQQHLAEQAKRGRWAKKWGPLLGYTLTELVQHLRRTLPKGCTWEQFMAGELHIDHITPRSRFDLTNEDELRACWSLGNLRLLPKAANIAKGARVECLL
jgi:hypothetical protein